MKYTKRYTTKDGETRFRFHPPEDVRKAGVLRSVTFRDGRKARYEIPRLIETVEAFRRGEIVGNNVDSNSYLKHLVAYYLNSKLFLSIAPKTQTAYEMSLKNICDTKVGSKKFGDIRLSNLTVRLCTSYYEKWVEERTVQTANRYSTILSIVLNYGASLDLIPSNPMGRVKKLKHEAKSEVWTREQVEKFLEVAFSEFKYRNIGLLVLMCYEWAQRPIDIRHLKWSNLDLENSRVKIKQSKRGATVELPIGEELRDMLTQQKEDWGFQEYVVPHYRPSDRAYRPMSQPVMSDLVHEVQEIAGIPTHLQAGNLRKTAIGEMVDAQIDSVSMMQVTGHRSIQSLNPYLRHTYEGAKGALDARNKYKEER